VIQIVASRATPSHTTCVRTPLLALSLLPAFACVAPIAALRPTPPHTVSLAVAAGLPPSIEGVAELMAGAGLPPARVHHQAGIVITRWCSLGDAPWYRSMPPVGFEFLPRESEVVVRLVVAFGPHGRDELWLTPDVLFCEKNKWTTDGHEVIGRCVPDGPGFDHEPQRRIAATVSQQLRAHLEARR
jgi:hypothetical protein